MTRTLPCSSIAVAAIRPLKMGQRRLSRWCTQPYPCVHSRQHLRSLRHPSILLFQWCQEDDDIVSIITEPALPLEMVAGNQPITPAEVALGLKDLLEALQFLAKVVLGACLLTHNYTEWPQSQSSLRVINLCVLFKQCMETW